MSDIVARIVERFRDAALGLCDWEDALALLARSADANMTQLSAHSAVEHTMLVNRTIGISADQMELYFKLNGHQAACNPRTRGLMTGMPTLAFTDADLLVGTRRSAFAIYDELFHRTDADHSVQVRLTPANDVVVGLTVMRSRRAGAFDRRGLRMMELIADGVGSATRAALALGTTQERTIVATIEMLGSIAILLGVDRAIVSLSPGAEQLLQSQGLTVRAGRLVAVDVATDRALERAFRVAASDETLAARQGRVILRAGRTPIVLDLSPLPKRMSGPISAARVLLTTRAPKAPEEAIGAAACAFALTPAETEIAALLAAGRTLQDVAERRGSAVSTVRSQLKAVFEKTGTRRQAELILLLRGGA